MSPVVTRVYTDPTQTSYTVNIDDSVTFQCVATGIPPPTITWYRNGTELSNSSNSRVTFGPHYVSSELDINDGTVYSVNRTLTLRMSEDEDHGRYECRARNEANLAEDSVEFELIVQCKLTYKMADYIAVIILSMQHLQFLN